MSEEMEKASLPADLGLGLAPARTSNIFGAQGQSPNTSYRGRSGSFNPTLLTYSSKELFSLIDTLNIVFTFRGSIFDGSGKILVGMPRTFVY